ncbi:thrombospondin type 3 repeat-containing protein, partial [bacterium]|nr:thrombospondin type 3 repeat-containing protein [bacterium]
MKRIVFLLLALTTFKLFSGIGEYHIKIGDIEVVSNSSVSHDCLDPIVGTDETNPLKLCHSSRNPNESANSWAREAQGMVYYTSTSYFYAHATDLRFIINNDRIGGIGLFNTDDFGHPVASIDLEFIVETMQESNCFELRHHINPTHGLYDAHIGEITYNHAENLLYVVVSPTRGTGDDVLATFNYIENDGFIFRSCMNNFADEPLFFNKMDNLLYLSSNNRRIKGFKKDFEKNSVFSNDLIVRVINLKGAPSIVGSFSGGSFSPNGRFFVRVAEKQDSDYAGLYIYEIDKKHLTQNELNDKFWLNKNMHLLDYNFTQFINFKFQGGTYCGEMEGMDIYPAKNGDIHVVFLQNEAVDDVFIFHFKALKDSDEDGIKDLYDNCPYDYNPEQEDYNNNGMGYICEDIDKDGIKNSEDECPLVHQIFGDVNFCLDNDTIDEYGHHVGDYVCNNPSNERKSCLYFYNQLTYKQRLEAVDKFKKERLEYLRENRWEPSFYLNGDNYLAIVENSPNRHLIDSCPNHINPLVKPFRSDSELIVGMCLNGKDTNGYCFPEDIITNTNQNDVVVWGGGAQLNPNTYLHGTVINGAYYWQPDHNLDGKGDACDTTDFGFVRVWGESYDKWLSSNDTATYTDVSLLHNHSITLENIELSESDVPFGANIDNRYCWMSSTEYAGDKWGDLGYCTLSKKYAEEQGENSNGVISYGFSHGSDPKPVDEDGKDSWKQPTMIRVSNKSEFYTIPVVSKGFVPGKETNRWKWQKDLENQSTYYDIWESKVEAVDNYDIEGNGASFMQYTLSTGYAKKSADEYLKGEGVDKEVNPDYFLNTNTAARAYRPYASPNGINYYRYTYRAYKSPLESLEDPRITSLLESGSNRLADTYLDPVINIWEMGDGFVEVIKRRKLDAGVATLFV